MADHQPKELTELAFASFTAYMIDQALQLLKWMQVSLPCAEIETKASGACSGLKDFFHGTRLPPVLANEITNRLLIKLDMFLVMYKSTREDYFRQILTTLVEIFMHPNITSIKLGSDYLHDCQYGYCNFILTVILKKVGSLHNLKTLSVGLGINIHLEGVTLVLPTQLKELTLCGSLFLDIDNLKSIVECCRELKSFKILRCSDSDISVPDILKLNHLETLHLLSQCSYGVDAVCVALINGLSADATSDVLSASTLKSFGIELRSENTLHLIVDKLPHLTEIVLSLPCEFDLSCLTQLTNLQSLTLDAGHRASDEYKKILPVLGKSLVILDLKGYINLDLEFIGETCSNLLCLHVDLTNDHIGALSMPSLKVFRNFRTVERLKVTKSDYDHEYDWVEFIIVQCLNIKVLSIVDSWEPEIISKVLKRTSLTSLEEIHFYPALITNNTCLEELCLKCPNLRLVHGLESNSFISRRVVFDTNGCRRSSCETFYSWCILDLDLDVPYYESCLVFLGCDSIESDPECIYCYYT